MNAALFATVLTASTASVIVACAAAPPRPVFKGANTMAAPENETGELDL